MAKTASFAAVHFTVAFSIGYLVTGSVIAGGTLALIEPLCNTIAYHFHEKIWAGRQRHSSVPSATRMRLSGSRVATHAATTRVTAR